jgi:hypothetical protein
MAVNLNDYCDDCGNLYSECCCMPCTDCGNIMSEHLNYEGTFVCENCGNESDEW